MVSPSAGIPLAALALLLSCSSGPDPRVAAVAAGTPEAEIADLILIAGSVHPLDGETPAGEAVAIQGTRILAVATRYGVLRHRGGRTKLVRFPGAHVFPGLVDAHGHLLGLGSAGVDLRGTRSLHEVVDRVAAAAAQAPAGAWILGRGWDQNLWSGKRMPDHRELSARVADHPVWLRRVGGHAALANARAMEVAGVGPRTADPAGGRILRLEGGAPSGVFIDRAMGLVARRVPATGEEGLQRALLAAQAKCLAAGLTRVHDAGVAAPVRRIVRHLEAEGKWKLGVYGMVPAPGGPAALPAADDPGPRARVRYRAAKMFADGALGSRGAALLADYSDEPGHRGLMTTTVDRLRDQIGWCRDRGYQPCVHAIGDRANRAVLDAYEEVLSAADRARLRPRIEHAQVLAPADLPRLAKLGVIASMQPTHLTTDMGWAPQRLGKARIPGAYAFATLLAGGTHVCFGSDFPVEPESPFDGIFAAVTTRPPRAPREGPLRPDQVLSRRQALAGFTAGPAFAAFEEEVRGRIRPGFEADLTIVDRNLLDVPEGALLATKVLATVVAGEIVYSTEEAGAAAR